MEDAESLKKEQESVTVNFENLHANMALDSQGGDITVESQKEEEKNPTENHGKYSEKTAEKYMELKQTELKGAQELDADRGIPEVDIKNADEAGTRNRDAAFNQVELKGNLTGDGGNTQEDGYDNDDRPNKVTCDASTPDQTKLRSNEAELPTSTSEADAGGTGRSDVIKQKVSEGGQTELRSEDAQVDADDDSFKDSSGKADKTDESTPRYELEKESGEMEEVAKGIIKNAVEGAAEQVSLEKSGDNPDLPKDDQEKSHSDPEWLDILGNGLLRKKILKSGIGVESRPLRESEVIIRYMARLMPPSGDEVVKAEDSFSFVLGEQDVISAFDLVVAFMQKGEVSLVESDSKYAYEDKGKPPKIPPKAGLVFEIELLDVLPGPFSTDIALDRRLKWADEKRLKGNTFYSAKEYAQASIAYGRATKALEKGWMNEESEVGRVRINEVRLKCYNNYTASRMKEEKWKDAMKSCRAAELLGPNNVKTLFRKGKIHCELGEVEKGVAVLSKAEKQDPDNKTVAAELAKQKRRLEKQNESRKKMYRRMMGTKGDESSTKPAPSSSQSQESNWLKNWGRVLGGTLAIGAILVGVYIAQRS